MRRFVTFACALVSATGAIPFRPPSTPLIVLSPYTSYWSPHALLAGNDTEHWAGARMPLYAAVRVDGGAPLALMGATGLAPAAQLGLPRVRATSTTYAFAAGGVAVNLTFTTPFLADEDLETHTRPAAYVSWSAASSDGGPHAVDVFFAAGGGALARFDNRSVSWARGSLAGASPPLDALVLTMSAADQLANITQRAWTTHAFDRADFGALHLVAEGATGCFAPSLAAALELLARNGSVGCAPADDARPPARVDAGVLAAVSWPLAVAGAPAAPPATARLTYFADEIVGLVNHDASEIVPPYWRRNRARAVDDAAASYALPVAEVALAVAAAPAALTAAAALDARVDALFARAGGDSYAALGALAYRQVYGQMGAMMLDGSNAIWNASRPFYFLKEASSDGALSTVDVILPAAPQLLYQSPTLFRMMLEPILAFTANVSCFNAREPGGCNEYVEPWPPHGMGQWPLYAPDGYDKIEYQWIEESGNMLLLSASLTQALGGDASWAAPYWAPLSSFAGVCTANLPFPAYTHSTDDFAGAIANYTNLALKCIGALGGWGYMHQAVGNASGAAHWYAAATGFAAQFVEYGLEPAPTPHIKQAFNSTPGGADGKGTWNLLYNGLFIRLLGLESLFPAAYPFNVMIDDHLTYLYEYQRLEWCVPLFVGNTFSKWDWLMWTSALNFTRDAEPVRGPFAQWTMDSFFAWTNVSVARPDGLSNPPLSDFPYCTGPAAQPASFRARPVLGALWAPLWITAPPPAAAREQAKARDFIRQAAAAAAARYS
jgi:hypothetical protein